VVFAPERAGHASLKRLALPSPVKGMRARENETERPPETGSAPPSQPNHRAGKNWRIFRSFAGGIMAVRFNQPVPL